MKNSSNNKITVLGTLITIVSTVIGNLISDDVKGVPILGPVAQVFKWIYDFFLKWPLEFWWHVFISEVQVWEVLISIIVAVTAIYIYINLNKPNPEFTTFTEAIFKKWLWKWRWQETNNGWEIRDLTPFCAKDRVQLVSEIPWSNYSYHICPECEEKFYDRENRVENKESIQNLIIARIENNNLNKA